eukprot:scaffold859_cov151-Skeletonema_marinoi.AAC.11
MIGDQSRYVHVQRRCAQFSLRRPPTARPQLHGNMTTSRAGHDEVELSSDLQLQIRLPIVSNAVKVDAILRSWPIQVKCDRYNM